MQFGKQNLDRNQPMNQRQIYGQDRYPDDEYGEMLYADPNGNQMLSPMIESQEQIMDQSDPQKPRAGYPPIRNDPRYNQDMAQLGADQPIPSLIEDIPPKNGKKSSPKLIYVI